MRPDEVQSGRSDSQDERGNGDADAVPAAAAFPKLAVDGVPVDVVDLHGGLGSWFMLVGL